MNKFGMIIAIFFVLVPMESFATIGSVERKLASEPSEADWIGWYRWMDQKRKDCGAGCIQRGARDSLTQDATFKIWRALEIQEQIRAANDDKDQIKDIVLAEIPEYCMPQDFESSGNPQNCFTRFEAVTVKQLRQIKMEILKSNENIASLRSRAQTRIVRGDAAEQAERAPINPTILTADRAQGFFKDEIGKSSEQLEELATMHFQEFADNFPKPPQRTDFYRYERRRITERGTEQGRSEDRFLKGCKPLEGTTGTARLCFDEIAYQDAKKKYEKDYEKALKEYRKKYGPGNPLSKTEALRAYGDDDLGLDERLRMRSSYIKGAVGDTTRKALERSGQIVMRRSQERARVVAPGVQSLEFNPQTRGVATDSVKVDEAVRDIDPRALGYRKPTQPDLHVTISPTKIEEKIGEIQDGLAD